MQGTSSQQGSILNPNAVYPRCLNPRKRFSQRLIHRVVQNQLERVTPPLVARPSDLKQTHKLWLEGKTIDPGYSATSRREAESPESESSPTGRQTLATFIDTADSPILNQMLEIKQKAFDSKRVHFDFWAPNPFSMNTAIYDEKASTYFFNNNPMAELGSQKAKGLKKHMNFVNDSNSTNELFYFLCKRILVPEQDLYQVDYREDGIYYMYISPFINKEDKKTIKYIKHVWMTRYFQPTKEDLDFLTKNRPDLDIQEPFIDGWTRLATLFTTGKLKKSEISFAERRSFKDIDQVKKIEASVAEEKSTWRIPTKETLLKYRNDWREALPPKIPGKDYLFVDLPADHHKYDETLYPYDLFSEDVENVTRGFPFLLRPKGVFYGIN